MQESMNDIKEPFAFGICRIDRGRLNAEKILQATYIIVKREPKDGVLLQKALIAAGETPDPAQSEQIFDISIGFLNEALNLCTENSEAADISNAFLLIAKYFEPNLFRAVFLFADKAPKSVEAVYLKLYLLSNGQAELRSLDLTGAFGVLPNVAWVGNTPVELEYLRANEAELRVKGEFPKIDFVDKFPRYLQHIVPADDVRILDGSKVRMGARLAEGTTVMPGASYVNFNAGTTGACMIEGRISSSAVVGADSDIGGGASILGVLSGTSGRPVSIGKNTLLGANSVTGIPLGDGCVVDAGIAVLEGTKITIAAKDAEEIAKINPNFNVSGESFQVVKGIDLAGMHGIHFRQNSQNGQMQAARSKKNVRLNAELH